MDIVWALVRSGLAIVFFFVLHAAGLITAIYSVIWAVRAQQKGHRHAPLVIGITVAVLICIIIGFVLRIGSGAYGSSPNGY
jgi:hypothetical protein